MSAVHEDEDDDSLLSILLKSEEDEGDSVLACRVDSLTARLIKDLNNPFLDSRGFWNRLDTSARNVGFVSDPYRAQDGLWRLSTEDSIDADTDFRSLVPGDHGVNHLKAVASLLNVSTARAAALTLDSLRARQLLPADQHSPSDAKYLSSQLGSMALLLNVRDFYYSRQIARVRFVTEALRLEAFKTQEVNEKIFSSCQRLLDKLDDMVLFLGPSDPCRRGCFLLLLSFACAPVAPLDRANVDPALQTFIQYHGQGNNVESSSCQDIVEELLLSHERHYNHNLRTEALEALLVLLYHRMDKGVQRRDWLQMFLAFEKQSFFIHKSEPKPHRDTMNSANDRQASLVSLILAESMCLWRAIPGENELKMNEFWMDHHPLFTGEKVQEEWEVLLQYLLDTASFQKIQQRHHTRIPSDMQTRNHTPVAMALLTFGLLLKLAALKPDHKHLFVRHWDDQIKQCLSIANDVYGVFDSLSLILSRLLPPSSASKTLLKRQCFKLFCSGYHWGKYSILESHCIASENASALLSPGDSSSLVDSDVITDFTDPIPIITYANIGREIILATISAFRDTILNSNSKDNIVLMCQLTAMIYRNNTVLCEKFWSEWSRYDGVVSKKDHAFVDPICLLLDTSYNMATSSLANANNISMDLFVKGNITISITGKAEFNALFTISPFIQLLASLICPNAFMIGQIITNFLPDRLIVTSLTCCLSFLSSNSLIADGPIYLEPAIKILQSLQILVSLAAMSKSSPSIHVLRCALNRTADPSDDLFGVKLLLAISVNALKNMQHDPSNREIVAYSCLSIIADLSAYFTQSDSPWICQVAVYLGGKGFKDFLFCGSDMVASRVIFLLQQMCTSLIPIVFFSSLEESDIRIYLKWIEESVLSLFDILGSVTPQDYFQSPPTTFRMNLVFGSITCIFSFLKAIGTVVECHCSKDIISLGEVIHNNLLTVMNSSTFFVSFLGYHSMLPLLLGIVHIKRTDPDDKNLHDLSSDVNPLEALEDSSWSHTNMFPLAKFHCGYNHELKSCALDNATAAIHMLALWSERDESFRLLLSESKYLGEDASKKILSYILLDFSFNESREARELFKAAGSFLMSCMGSPNLSLSLEGGVTHFPIQYMSIKSVMITLIEDMNLLNDRYHVRFGGKVFLVERVTYLLLLISVALNNKALSLNLCRFEKKSLLVTLISIIERYGKRPGSYLEARFLSIVMQTLVILWDAHQRDSLVNSSSETSTDDRLLTLCYSLIDYHVESKLFNQVETHVGSFIYQLLSFCLILSTRIQCNARFSSHYERLQSLAGVLDTWLQSSEAYGVLCRLKESYHRLNDEVKIKVPRDSDWIGFIEKVAFGSDVESTNGFYADFHGNLSIAAEFFMLFTPLKNFMTTILIRRSTDNDEAAIKYTDNVGPLSSLTYRRNVENLLRITTSLADPLFDLLSTNIPVDRFLLTCAMNSISAMADSLLFSVCIQGRSEDRNHHLLSCDSVEIIVHISHLSNRLSLLSSSYEEMKSVITNVELTLLIVALEAMKTIKENNIIEDKNMRMNSAFMTLARISCKYIHYLRLHFSRSDITPCLSHHLMLLQASLAVIETVLTHADTNFDDVTTSFLSQCTVIEDTIFHFILLSEAVGSFVQNKDLSPTSDFELSNVSSSNIVSVLSSVVYFLQSLGEKRPSLFLGNHFLSTFLKSSLFSSLLSSCSTSEIIPSLKESDSILGMDLQRLNVSIIRFLSTLLRHARKFCAGSVDLDRLAMDIFDFIRTYDRAILIKMDDIFTVRPVDGDCSKPTTDMTFSSTRSSYAPSFTRPRLKEAREILRLLNELFHSKALSNMDQVLFGKLISATLKSIKALSLFLGSISNARELFSLLRLVDSSLRPHGHGSSHMHDAMIRHPVLSDGIPYARSQAINYAHFASSCCISLTREENDLRNQIFSGQKKVSNVIDTIDQRYEDGINNEFISTVEELAMECTMLGILIIDLAHSAGSLVVLSPGEARHVSDSSLFQSTAYVSYRREERSTRSFVDALNSIEDQSFGRVLRYNLIRNTIDVQNVETNMEEKDISSSRLLLIEDVRKRKHIFDLVPAPRSFSTLISNALLEDVSLGNLILVLRWCGQTALTEKKRKSQQFDRKLKYLAESSALLLGTEISLHISLKTDQTLEESSIKEIGTQLKQLFQETDTYVTTRCDGNALKSIMDTAIWDFTTDAMKELLNNCKI